MLRSAAHEGITGLDPALRRFGELARGGTGSVRVTKGATSVRHFMSEAVVAFRDRHPGTVLEFRTEPSGRSCFDGPAEGAVDLAWATLGDPVRFLPLPVGWAVRRWTALDPPARSFADLIEEQHGAAYGVSPASRSGREISARRGSR